MTTPFDPLHASGIIKYTQDYEDIKYMTRKLYTYNHWGLEMDMTKMNRIYFIKTKQDLLLEEN